MAEQQLAGLIPNAVRAEMSMGPLRSLEGAQGRVRDVIFSVMTKDSKIFRARTTVFEDATSDAIVELSFRNLADVVHGL
jgi:hypothetical protein